MAQQNLRPWQSENTPICQPQTTSRPVVLIVEPHAMWRLFLQAVLTLYQYSVVTATTEEEAEAVKQGCDTAELGLVIVDMHLSDDLQARTGLQLVERWQAAEPARTYILMSDYPNDAGLLTFDCSTVSFLAKPFLRQDVLEVLARGMERTCLINRQM